VTTEDVLGAGYQVRTIPLPPDEEGEVVATLVHRSAEQPNGAAVLYLHGFSDYFFQTELADFHTARGTDFYALDLRKYGRSLRDHQTPGYILDIREYFPELTEATRIIREEHGHRRMVINAHSTGGLIAALWAHHVRDQDLVDGLVLNSPWLDMQGGWMVRHPVTEAVNVLGRIRPRARIRPNGTGLYGFSIHRDHHGEWEFDLKLKPIEGFPIHAGWLRAIRWAHRWVHHGLAIRCPVLVMSSAGSLFRSGWTSRSASTPSWTASRSPAGPPTSARTPPSSASRAASTTSSSPPNPSANTSTPKPPAGSTPTSRWTRMPARRVGCGGSGRSGGR
jgi:alpha-beta hydrolase superfamily lysophospholipase